MVREILTVQLGQCGNNIGNVFWETLLNEHKLDYDGTYIPLRDQLNGDDSKDSTNDTDTKTNDKSKKKDNKNKKDKKVNRKSKLIKNIRSSSKLSAMDHTYLDKLNVFFYESNESLRFVPRSIFVDLDPSILDSIKSSKIGKLYKNDNFIFGQNSAANNYAKGRYTEGADLENEIMDVIRRESEDCDCLQSIQMTHAIGGGTGSGLGSLLQEKLRDYFKDRIQCAYTIFPSKNTSQIVVEDYNAVLALNDLIANIDESFVIDNHSLFNIAEKLKMGSSLRDLNWLISLVMSGITSSLRFPGQLNGDLRKLGVNLVPFPRLHFFACAQFPLFEYNKNAHTNLTIPELTKGIMDRTNYYVDIKPETGRCLAASIVYRGDKSNISTYEVENTLMQMQDNFWEDFVEWIPNAFKTSVINVPMNKCPLTSTFVSNHTGIVQSFERICKNSKKLLKKKAFLHRYKEEGLEETDIVEAMANIKDLITEYQDKEHIHVYDYGAADDANLLSGAEEEDDAPPADAGANE